MRFLVSVGSVSYGRELAQSEKDLPEMESTEWLARALYNCRASAKR